MIGIIIAFLLGYWLGEKEELKEKEYADTDYIYVKEGESVKDLI